MPRAIQQELKPVRVPESVSYVPVEDKPEWQIDRWPALARAFELQAGELPLWHAELAGQGRPWSILRLLYQIGPLFGEAFDPDVMRPWTAAEIAGKFGITQAAVDEEHAAAVAFWQRRRQEVVIERRIAANTPPGKPERSGDEGDVEDEAAPEATPAASIQGLREVADGDVEQILIQAGFPLLKKPEHRLYCARRIVELERYFSAATWRETARQIVFSELNMREYERKLLEQNLNAKEFRETEQSLTSLAEKHRKLLSEIGADQEEQVVQKSFAIDTFSYFARAMQEWYATGERKLIDGVFTAEEVMWLLTPSELRGSQYRPDIVVRLHEALRPENLWAEDYEPTPIQRQACRALKKIVSEFGDELATIERKPAPSTDPETSSEESIEAEESAAAANSAGDDAPPSVMPSFVSSSRRQPDEELFMVVN
jgi:hypothetical protein